MSIIKAYTAFADTRTYFEDNEGATFGNAMEYCIKPALEEIFGTLQYKVSSSGYPCILIPGSDGMISADYSPCICIPISATATNTSSSNQIQIGIIDVVSGNLKSVEQGYSYFFSGGSKENQIVSQNLTTQGIMFNARDIEGYGYQLGTYPSSGSPVTLGSMQCKILKGKDVMSGEKTDVCFSELYGNTSSAHLVFYKPSTNSIISENIERWVLPTQTSCANIYELNEGNIMIEDFYLCFPLYQKILKPLVVLDPNATPTDMWSNTVTINGSNFTLSIPPGVGTSGNSSMTLARKLN